MKRFGITAMLAACTLTTIAIAAEDRSPLEMDPPLFAFDNGVGRGKLQPVEQAALLKELGYDGIGYTGASHLPERLAAFEKAGLKVFSIYVGVTLKPGGYETAFDVPKAVALLKGQETDIWLTISGKGGEKAEESAVAAVREIADAAAPAGLRVILYPHAGFYVDTTDDGTRLARLSQRPNVGTSFNLCHWLKVEPDKPLSDILDRAGDRLMLVSINGADQDTKAWPRLIQPLGDGTFAADEVLTELKARGYKGPIGLQCFNITAPPREHLRRSIAAWRGMVQ